MKLFKIPSMNQKVVLKRYQNIKLIIKVEDKLYYARQLTSRELKSIPYDKLGRFDIQSPVDMSKIEKHAEIETLHSYSRMGVFCPGIEEIIAQIPRGLFKDTVAIQLVYGTQCLADFEKYREQVFAGFHVGRVCLYRKK